MTDYMVVTNNRPNPRGPVYTVHKHVVGIHIPHEFHIALGVHILMPSENGLILQTTHGWSELLSF